MIAQVPRRYVVPLTAKRKVTPDHPELSFKRSYPTGIESFFRIYQGEELSLFVDVIDKVNCFNVKMVLHSNVNTTDFAVWEDLPFEREGNRFSIKLRIDKPGSYRFKMKYSLDDGQTWMWDKVSHTYVIADPEHMRNLKLYTLIPTRSGHIGDWAKLLPYIKDLGFNAVHLLPITKMGLSESPYAAKCVLDIDESYAIPGDKRSILDQFEEEFILTAKDLGLRLCFDIVLNHVGIDSEIVRRRPEWIKNDPEQKDGFKRAGCWDYEKWVVWKDLCLLNYDHPDEGIKAELWEFMKEYALFWANYASFTDGLVRLDNMHSTYHDFLRFVFREMRDAYPNILILAELFSDFDTVKKLSVECGVNLLMGTPWGEKYVPGLRKYLAHIHRVGGHVRYLTPLNSHDSGAPAEEYGSNLSIPPRYVTMALFGLPYTGLCEGAEVGVLKKVPFIGRDTAPIVDLKHPVADHRDFIQKVNQIQDEYSAFGEVNNVTFIDGEHIAIIAILRKAPRPTDPDFILLANFDILQPQTLKLDLAKCNIDLSKQNVLVTDMFTKVTVVLQPELTLKPGETMVLRIEK